MPEACAENTGNLSAYVGKASSKALTGSWSFCSHLLLDLLFRLSPCYYLNSSRTFKPEHSAVGGLEAIEFGLGLREVLGGDNGFESLDGKVPQLLMLSFQQDDCACRLRVEAAWDVLDGVVDDLDDSFVGNRRLCFQPIDCAAVADGFKESGRVAHFRWYL